MTGDVVGRRMRVHFNLQRGGWSITDLKSGRVVANVADVTLTGVTFRVQPAMLARIRATGRRKVCAYAVGTVTAADSAPDVSGCDVVAFNPHRADTFTRAGEPVLSAPEVAFVTVVRDGRQFGYGYTRPDAQAGG